MQQIKKNIVVGSQKRIKEFRYELRPFQLRNVCLLETIDKVCREHDIKYYVIAGTLLGAVRHKGFIPWDDDMDIGMMRQDYDTLIEHAEEWLPEPFHIVTHENCDKYPKYFAKLEDISTTIVENFHLGYKGGIYMDIFALDEVPNNKLKRWFHYKKFMLSRQILYFMYRDPYKHGRGPRSWWPALLQKLFTRNGVHSWSQKVLKEYFGKPNCDYLMTHDDGFRAFDKKFFGEPSILEFEGFRCCGPSDYSNFLSVMYGSDYMELPPEEKRRSHYYEYCDLNTPYAGADINELRKKKDELQVFGSNKTL